jgi:RNA polymerase sigma factor (TIGR02999 family)
VSHRKDIEGKPSPQPTELFFSMRWNLKINGSPDQWMVVRYYSKLRIQNIRSMTLSSMSDITQVLQAIRQGDGRASEELLPLVYNELRHLAAARMAQEATGQTLQATALVHEAWLRMVGDGDKTWQNRAHFFGAAAEAMRRILVENARRKSRLKRGGGQIRLDIDDLDLAETTPDEKVLLMDEALEELQKEDPEKARIVVLKFFGGLTNQEVAKNLGVAERTVERQWAYAKAWLFQKIRA